MDRLTATLHDRALAYRDSGGAGPAVVLVHGITQDASTWEAIWPSLSGAGRLIALDLPGHGDSDIPAGDHSMGAYATIVRDLLLYLEVPSATVVGHSLGGGVALQFAYQFPTMIDRLVLLDAGGLGQEVSPLLRAATLPGAGLVLPALSTAARTPLARWVTGQVDRRVGRPDLDAVRRGMAGMVDADARRAFLLTARASIGIRGQRVSALDKLYLARHIPTLLVWGAQDRIIPVAHGRAAADHIDGADLVTIPDAGHFPHETHAAEVAQAIVRFIDRTTPSEVPRAAWGAVLREAADEAAEEAATAEGTPMRAAAEAAVETAEQADPGPSEQEQPRGDQPLGRPGR